MQLDSKGINTLFPFFILINEDLHIREYGKYWSDKQLKNNSFASLFGFIRPKLSIQHNFSSYITHTNVILIIEHLESKMKLRGQFYYDDNTPNQLLFVGSPWLSSDEELTRLNLRMSDFAVYDPVMENLQLLKHKENLYKDTELLNNLLKKQNIELETKETLYREIVENSGDFIFRTDVYGNCSYANKAMLDFLMVSASELQQTSLLQLLNKKHLEQLKNFYTFQYESNEAVTYIESPIVNKEQKEIWLGLTMSLVANKSGKKEFIGNARDITERKSVEKALMRSEEKYRSIIENLELGLIETDRQGIITQVYPKFSELTGYDADEILGTDGTFLLEPEFVNELQTQTANRKKGEATLYELKIRCKDGNSKWFLVSGAPFYGPNDELIGTIGVHVDITEKKELGEEILKIKNNLESILNEMTEVVFSFQAQPLELLFVSPSAEDIFGPELKSSFERWPEFIHPEDSGIFNLILKSIEKGDPFLNVLRLINFKGETIWVEAKGSIIFDHNQTPQRIDGTLRNISELVNKETQIQQQITLQNILIKLYSEYINTDVLQYHDVIQQSLKEIGEFVQSDRTYIFEYDYSSQTLSNTYEWCNEGIDAYIEVLQNIPMDLFPKWIEQHEQGHAYTILNVELLNDEDEAELKQTLTMQGIKSIITIPMLHNGSLKGFVGFDYVKGHTQITKVEEQLLFLYAQMLINLDDRFNREKALREAKSIVENALAVKEIFLANMSHEIRTPLGAIKGLAELLIAQETRQEENKQLNAIIQSSEHLLHLVNNILNYSKLNAKKMELDLEWVAINRLLEAIETLYRPKAAQKNLELSFNIELQHNSFYMDKFKFQEVLNNLLGNALKFTQHGKIELFINEKPLNATESKLFVEVRDTGIGIDETLHQKIFEEFSQIKNKETKASEGTGLGLSIAHEIVKLMGGELQVVSKINEGSSFTFKFITKTKKINKEISEKPITENKDQFLANKNTNVLIVDDSEINLFVLKRQLEQIHVTVFEALSAKQAYEILKNHEINCIFLDIQMPEIDGFEAAKFIRENLNYKERIFALTANNQLFYSEEIRKIGIDEIIHKPISMDQLCYCISNLKKTSDLDIDKLMHTFLNDKGTVLMMLQLMKETLHTSIIELKQSFDNKNFEKYKSILHKIKPSIKHSCNESLFSFIVTQEKENNITQNHLNELIYRFEKIIQEIVSIINESK